jgi:hypothetical protein
MLLFVKNENHICQAVAIPKYGQIEPLDAHIYGAKGRYSNPPTLGIRLDGVLP